MYEPHPTFPNNIYFYIYVYKYINIYLYIHACIFDIAVHTKWWMGLYTSYSNSKVITDEYLL